MVFEESSVASNGTAMSPDPIKYVLIFFIVICVP
jgi:hypothetical protein